jgi:hypothetical protein
VPAPAASSSASSTSAPIIFVVDHLVLVGEVVLKVNALFILQLYPLLLNLLCLLKVIVSGLEAKQSSSVDCIGLSDSVMHNVEMGFLLVFCLERDIAFRSALVIWTDEVGFGEVALQGGVVAVVHVLVMLVAQVTCQVHSLQMVQKDLVVEVVLLAEVAPRMGQDFCTLLRPWVAVLNVISQLPHVVDALLSDEHRPARQTHLAESLLVRTLKVPSERLHIREVLRACAVVH